MEKSSTTWVNANSGYWAHPLEAYTRLRSVVRRSQGEDLQGYGGEPLLERLCRADLDRKPAPSNADYVVVQMYFGRDRRRDAGGAAASRADDGCLPGR